MNTYGRCFRVQIYGESHGKGVGVIIVVHQAGVLVGPRHGVDVEFSLVIISHVHPQPGRLQKDLRAALLQQFQILGGQIVGRHTVGNVAADVVLGGPGGEVPGALLAHDGAPGEGRPLLMSQQPCVLLGVLQDGVAVANEIFGNLPGI